MALWPQITMAVRDPPERIEPDGAASMCDASISAVAIEQFGGGKDGRWSALVHGRPVVPGPFGRQRVTCGQPTRLVDRNETRRDVVSLCSWLALAVITLNTPPTRGRPFGQPSSSGRYTMRSPS